MQQTSPFQNSDVAAKVVCRRGVSYWWGAAIFALFGWASFTGIVSTSPRGGMATVIVALGIASFFFGFAVYGALAAVRNHIIATEERLKWRGFGRERTVRWEEVSDFYLRNMGKPGTIAFIETPRGNIRIHEWVNQQALLDMVPRCATAAKAKSWDLRGVRPEDEWPRIFIYDTADNRWTPIFLVGGLVFLAGVFLSSFSWTKSVATLALMWRWSGPALTVVCLLVTVAAALLLPLLVLTIHLPQWQQLRSRREESFTATPLELVWRQGAASRSIRWSDVTHYYLRTSGWLKLPNVYVVETGRDKMEWMVGLAREGELARITVRYAVNAAETRWKESGAFRAGDGARKEHSRTGQRVFDLRNKTSRAMLWFSFFFFGQPLLRWGCAHFFGPLPNTPSLALSLAMLCAPLWLTWRYYAAKVTLTLEGILQSTPFGSRFIPWNELESAEIVGADMATFLCLSGRNRKLWIYACVGGTDDLRNLIHERLAQQKTV